MGKIFEAITRTRTVENQGKVVYKETLTRTEQGGRVITTRRVTKS